MKNKTLKILSLGLAVTTAFSTSTPVFAYEVDGQDNSIESVEYQNTEDEDFNNATNVFAQLGSEYKVTIPKVVVLSGASKDARYYVKVEGDIAGYEKINVIPEDSFKLSAKNKADETATISQDKTVWTVHDFDTDANGTISADGITAGKWTGAFNFNINLESDDISALPEEKVLGDLVIPDANEWKGQILSDIYIMEVGDTGILEATNDGKDVSDTLEITSSNEDVVKVENKQLKAVNAGQTTITTVYEDKSFSVKIKVVKPETPTHTHTPGAPVRENEVEATCTTDGSYDEVTYCTICGERLSTTPKTVEALGHNYNSVDTDPTCTEDGFTTHVCARCGDTYTDSTVPALGHVPSTPVRKNEVAATCTEEGSYDEVTYCTICNKELSRTTKVIPKLLAAGPALADMSFADIQAVAKAGKAADYGIKVGDTINVNSTVQAQVTEIGEDYIEFATTSKVVSANSPQTKSTLKTGQSVTSSGPAAMYKYPQVNYSDKDNTTTVSYNGSDLQTNVRAWFDAQSNEFKAAVKDTNVTYETATLTFNGIQYSQTAANGTVEVAEKVYIPSKADLESGKFASNPAYTSNYFWTSTPYAFYGWTGVNDSFGIFYRGYYGSVSGNFGGYNNGAVALFRIG